MRVNQIESLLTAMRAVMYAHPSLRLGQIINNVVPPGRDPYYITDAELAAALVEYARA